MTGGGKILFKLGPLSTAIDAGELEAWAAGAEPGAVKVYCEGPMLLQAAASVLLARELYEEGLVRLHFRRSPKGFQYYALRQVPPVEPVTPKRVAVPVPDDQDDHDEAVFRLLKRRANLGQPCSTNAEIATEIGLPNADAASYRVRKLHAAGLIRVEDRGPNERRIVTIVETGKRTVPGAL
jgi:hypothetical protein